LIAGLADALDATFALLQSGGVPGKVDVDQGAKPLQVEAFRGGVGAEKQLDFAFADAVFKQGAVAALETAGLFAWDMPEGAGMVTA
jgi:hypothetical protein